MQWIIDHFQVVILIGLGLASWLKARMDAKNAAPEEEDDAAEYTEPASPSRRAPSVPRPLQRSTPPPLQRPTFDPARQSPGTTASTQAAYEAAHEAAAALKHQQDLEERLRQIRENKTNTSGNAAVTRARATAKNRRTNSPTLAIPASYKSRLRDPAELRRAFVMREILEAPLGLR